MMRKQKPILDCIYLLFLPLLLSPAALVLLLRARMPRPFVYARFEERGGGKRKSLQYAKACNYLGK